MDFLSADTFQLIIMIIKVILLDVALGADNSAIIGMAARNLNVNLRKKAILIGTGGAIVARFVLAAVATYLMQILFLKTVGAIILIFIGINLIAGEETDDKEVAESNTLLGAIKTIIIADVIMSLDNVLAIVGATDGHLGMLIFGMIISVPIIIFGSTIVLKLMSGYYLFGWNGYRMGCRRYDRHRYIFGNSSIHETSVGNRNDYFNSYTRHFQTKTSGKSGCCTYS